MKITEQDSRRLDELGITPERLELQLEQLANGFPFLRLEGAATVGHGITRPSQKAIDEAIRIWDDVRPDSLRVYKMVPASGAASRMFKNVFAFLNSGLSKAKDDFMRRFFDHITDFAFFPELNAAAMKQYGKSVLTLIGEGKENLVTELLLTDKGLNYGKLPKALLLFHKILGSARTALEEHLAEGAQYAADRKGNVTVHFTVSPEHLEPARRKVEEAQKRLEKEYGVRLTVTFSVQKPSTDTVAANLDGTPYRENGELFFRPGGHGALIENLNDLDADIVFLKNIDNVVPDSRREDTIKWKKVLGGILLATKTRIDEYCRELASGLPSHERLETMLKFLRTNLCITHDKADGMSDMEKAEYIFGKLHRPLRVCGMVPNEGEPGGGPFLVYGTDDTVQPQILETSQIDLENPKAAAMLAKATHFNPVDLVCAIRDYKGNKFDLPEYVDQATGFISSKSREGVEIKALELPGLWNGAMAGWNTVFIEVPASTFNPVKTVNDLLRPAHQA